MPGGVPFSRGLCLRPSPLPPRRERAGLFKAEGDGQAGPSATATAAAPDSTTNTCRKPHMKKKRARPPDPPMVDAGEQWSPGHPASRWLHASAALLRERTTTLIHDASQLYLRGIRLLVDERTFCMQRGTLGLHFFGCISSVRGYDITVGVQGFLQATLMATGAGPVLAAGTAGQQQQQQGLLPSPATRGQKEATRRLTSDEDVCYTAIHFTREGPEQVTCSKRMEELFVSARELQGMQEQVGVLMPYLWCTFVVPEDRARLKAAFAHTGLERSGRLHLDTVLRCVTRTGHVTRCLASMSVHGDASKGQILLRLVPLMHRSLSFGTKEQEGGGPRGRRERQDAKPAAAKACAAATTLRADAGAAMTTRSEEVIMDEGHAVGTALPPLTPDMWAEVLQALGSP